MSNNQGHEEAPATPKTAQLQAVSDCLIDYLKVHGKSSQAFCVLQTLAEETLRCIGEGKDARFNYFAIRSRVTGEKEGDASAWFSRHWKALNGEIRQAREEGLQKFSADRGLDVYPWIEKQESNGGAGNQALVSIVALPIPAGRVIRKSEVAEPPHDIHYIPAENLKLSWWARWLFDGNHVASGWRKGIIIWPTLLWLAIVSVVALCLLYIMSRHASPVTSQDLVITICLGLLAWYANYVVRRFVRFVDDRMIMASEHMVGFREFGVCIELFKPGEISASTPKNVRMIKYAAQCPTCGAQVLLDEGEPDFPRRIVGRCQESPREHVFSFDRATRAGYQLR